MSTIVRRMIPILALAVAFPAAADCKHTRELRIDPVSAAGITSVRVDASAGSLEIRGGNGATIRAQGKACASSDSRLEDIELLSRRNGDTLEIRVEIESTSGLFFRRNYASLDLEVDLPEGMNVEIDDGSGSIRVTNVGDLEVDDGSGDLSIRNAGNVWIDDGSGDIQVVGIRGDVEVDDGSGDVEIEDVSGTVRIDDGSGDVEIANIGRDVVIEDDGSGSLSIVDVRGNLRVGDHGSGGISYDRIGGDVTIRDDR